MLCSLARKSFNSHTLESILLGCSGANKVFMEEEGLTALMCVSWASYSANIDEIGSICMYIYMDNISVINYGKIFNYNETYSLSFENTYMCYIFN